MAVAFFDRLLHYVDAAAAHLEASFPGMQAAHADVSVLAKWFLSPRQHVVEWLAWHALLLPLVAALSRVRWVVDVPALPRRVSSTSVWKGARTDAVDLAYSAGRRKGGALLRAADAALCLLAWVTGPATVWYKLQNGREAYLLQPCHLQNFVIMYLTLDTASPFAAGLFHFYVCTVYGTLLAIATPDMRGLYLPLEKEAFYAQHYMLIALPLVWVVRRRYPLYAGAAAGGAAGFASVLLTWAAFFLLHLDVFLPASLLTLRNVNYMLVPPPGPLEAFGRLYRPVMAAACVLLGLLSRDGIVAAVVWAAGLREDARAEAVALEALEGGGGWASPLSAPAGGVAGAGAGDGDAPAADDAATPTPAADGASGAGGAGGSGSGSGRSSRGASPRTPRAAAGAGGAGARRGSVPALPSSPVAAGAAVAAAGSAGAGAAAGDADADADDGAGDAPAAAAAAAGGARQRGTPGVSARLYPGDTQSSAAKKRTPSPAPPGAVARRKSGAAK